MIHFLRVLCEKWIVSLDAIVSTYVNLTNTSVPYRSLNAIQLAGSNVYLGGLPNLTELRREVEGWLLSNLAMPVSFSSYDQDAWSALPSELSSIRLGYVQRYVREQLGMDPYTTVDVQGKEPCVPCNPLYV